MKHLVSVIVPVYNVQAYLDRCVQSIVDQTYSNLEILLIDDGSTDESYRLMQNWAEKDKRIHLQSKRLPKHTTYRCCPWLSLTAEVPCISETGSMPELEVTRSRHESRGGTDSPTEL